MAALAGLLHRPVSTAAAVAVAAVSFDLPDRFSERKSPDTNVTSRTCPDDAESRSYFKPATGVSGACTAQNLNFPIMLNSLYRTSAVSPAASLPVTQAVHHYARFSKLSDDNLQSFAIPNSSPDVSYRWYLPDPKAYGSSDACSSAKSRTVVVLLGWLGAKQKHMRRYAEWYTSRGFHVVAFTFPLSEVVGYKTGGQAEQNLEMLADHLAGWVAEENGKKLVFHTFSNTGWLAYGVVLEKLHKENPSAIEKIKGCIVDSAPVDAPNPQVWASGFSAAFLKKNSIATQGMSPVGIPKDGALVLAKSTAESRPALTEAALLAVLEKFFEVVLKMPSINRRLRDVLDLLISKQPMCPQLYIYSSADRVIPAKSVESFIEKQKRGGHEVRSCDFVSSPHVDHFRSHPGLYTSQLTNFLVDYILCDCKESA